MISYLFLSLLIAVEDQASTLPGSCSFKETTCDYVPDLAFLRWTLNPNEHSISVKTDIWGDQRKAVLMGPDMEQLEWSCLQLVYQLTGSGSLHIYTRSQGESFDYILWSANIPSDGWLVASIDLNTTEAYKLIIEGRPGPVEGSSVSIFEINFADKYCIECNFEESHLCGYTNEWNGNFNWYVGRGAPNEPTHNDWAGNYLYVDSVYTMTLKEVAKLVSPMTTQPMLGCLSFQYQQDTSYGHLLSVYSRDQIGQYSELWRTDQPKSNQVEQEADTKIWIPVQVDLRAPHPVQVLFEASFNSPKGGRLLLDDISFSTEFCNEETEPKFDPAVANCDFELDFCQYTQNMTERETWRRVLVWPNTYRTGDHTTGKGSFLLANSRFTLQYGYTTRLYGPQLPGNQKYCLKFFYLVRNFSKTAEILTVYLYDTSGSKWKKIWILNEGTRDVWMQVELDIQSQNTTQVVFISTCKNALNCVFSALDDISLRLGDCKLPIGSQLVPSHCDFENGLCGYTQEKKSNAANWVLTRGPTPTSNTGPNGDHTTGFGHYLYIEASQMLSGQSAGLMSVPLRGLRGAQCLHFFYHMYGSGTGQLSVLLRSERKDRNKLLWVLSGEQSISWLKASVTYQYDHQHQIIFVATRGPSVRSDIAIDDIRFQKGPCKGADQHV